MLFFVRKDELNIYDIPIARITKSYLEYLQLMQDLNLDIASEFILMAATLMRIKVKMMLPKDPVAEEEEEMMDPREELSRRLIEYRQFKEASKSLSELDEYWRQVYRRSYFNFDLLPQNEEEVIGLKDISFFDLLTAYKKALEKKPIPVFHNVERLNVTVEDQQKYIMAFFRDRNCYLFTELCDDMAKIEIVVTFLALLDLVKRADIAIKQASIFDDIWIYRATEFKEEEIPESERAEESIQELTRPLETESANTEAQDHDSLEPTKEPLISETAEIDIEFKSDASQSFEVTQDQALLPVDTEITASVIEGAEKAGAEAAPSPEIVLSDKESNGAVENEERTAITFDMSHDTGKIELESLRQDAPISNEAEKFSQTEAADLLSEENEYRDTAVSVGPPGEKIRDEQDEETAAVSSVEVGEEERHISENVTIAEIGNEKVKSVEPEAAPVIPPIIAEIVDNISHEPVVEPVKNEKKAGAEEKVPRWKNFLHKIVSMVRRIFSK